MREQQKWFQFLHGNGKILDIKNPHILTNFVHICSSFLNKTAQLIHLIMVFINMT